ncbi:phage minor capsid protein [Streptomyces sp. V4-01]|uniref:Phage minor capsid protein n=1 Tax=Actinacidiphila polyblastidii TaxID=3110430 RepID=A0ABU7P6N2_9ACTN|nr:phage minor capsid protein [Streptomyces sp. V4-01]
MPTSPATAATLSRPVRDLYAAAELDLLHHLADELGQDLDSPRWAERRLRAVGNLRGVVDRRAAALRRTTTTAVDRALLDAYDRGRREAIADLGRLTAAQRRSVDAAAADGARSVRDLAAGLERDSRPLYRRIVSSVTGAYRQIVARAEQARDRAAEVQRALTTYAGRGIVGLVDEQGRGWSMTGWIDSAVRTAAGRALLDGHSALLSGVGLSLVVVSNSPLECPLCRPWESKVLTLDAAPGRRVVLARNGIGAPLSVPVLVAGSLEQARAAGLYHANCRHTLRPYVPGLSSIPDPAPAPRRATYEDTQRQRYLERQLRAWRRREAVALDDRARAAAQASIRSYDARLIGLTRVTGLPRQHDRERIPT